MRAGTAFSQLIEFLAGFPDGDISWSLLDETGVLVVNGVVTPVADSVSAVVTVPAEDNTLEVDELSSSRELNWSYAVGGVVQNGRYRYRLEAFLPLGVSEQGVRRKLGVEQHEIDDEAIDLVGAYGRFREMTGVDDLAAVTGHDALLARDAIEALAGIAQISALQIGLAAKESSGTNQFQRATIKWDAIRAQLEAYLEEGLAAVNPTFDPTADFGSLLTVVVREDPVTGETA